VAVDATSAFISGFLTMEPQYSMGGLVGGFPARPYIEARCACNPLSAHCHRVAVGHRPSGDSAAKGP
jgi:hypothetical protein